MKIYKNIQEKEKVNGSDGKPLVILIITFYI